MTYRSRLLLPALSLTALFALASHPAPAATGALVEKTVSVPRDAKVALDMVYEKAALTWVESQNDPQDRDVKEASEKDTKDTTFVLLRFHYRNGDYVKHRVKLRAVLLDEHGGVVGEAGRSGTLDPKQTDDTISFPMKLKTIDWPKAARLKVIATFLD